MMECCGDCNRWIDGSVLHWSEDLGERGMGKCKIDGSVLHWSAEPCDRALAKEESDE